VVFCCVLNELKVVESKLVVYDDKDLKVLNFPWSSFVFEANKKLQNLTLVPYCVSNGKITKLYLFALLSEANNKIQHVLFPYCIRNGQQTTKFNFTLSLCAKRATNSKTIF
jgi:hypothetical protein